MEWKDLRPKWRVGYSWRFDYNGAELVELKDKILSMVARWSLNRGKCKKQDHHKTAKKIKKQCKCKCPQGGSHA